MYHYTKSKTVCVRVCVCEWVGGCVDVVEPACENFYYFVEVHSYDNFVGVVQYEESPAPECYHYVIFRQPRSRYFERFKQTRKL